MTEAEWLACNDPRAMMEFLERRGSERKLRLCAVACCRRAWALSDDPRHREAVEAAERDAEGKLGAGEFEEALRPVVELWAKDEEFEWDPFHYMTAATRHLGSRGAAKYAASFVVMGLGCLQGEKGSPPWLAAVLAEEAAQCSLIRDIFGDPSRPFQFDPMWLCGEGASAVELARRIDEGGRYDELPSLADALERAGCHDRAVLDHCRAPGPHVRGCWVPDALLGRESAVQVGLATEADWRVCEDPTALLHFLRDKGTERKWRQFAVACCRRIEHLMSDERSRRAIEVVARYTEGAATDEELEAARATAQEAQDEAKEAEWHAEAQENFCLTPRYADVSRALFAAKAARSAACRDSRVTDGEPVPYDARNWEPANYWATAAVRYDVYAAESSEAAGSGEQADDFFMMTDHGKLSSGPPLLSVRGAADNAERAEMQVQCAILHDLFGEFLGPPGKEGEWIPCGAAAPTSEWWCRLPTPRKIVVRPEWMEWSEGAVPKLARQIHSEERFDRLPLLVDALEKAGCNDPTILGHLRGDGPHVRGCWVVELLTGREHLRRVTLAKKS